MKKICFLNNDWNNAYRKKYNKYGGVGYYRMFLPKLGLEKITDWEVDFVGSDFEKMIDPTNEETILKSYINFFNKYDLVVIKHFDNPNAGRFIVAASDITGVPYVTDLDDDVLSVRKDQPAYTKGYKKGEVQNITVATMLSFSKALFVTNEYLGNKISTEIEKMCGVKLPYYVLNNYNNAEEWAVWKSKQNTNRTVIGWHGSITHNSDLEMVFPVLKRILMEFKDVKLALMGGMTTEYALEIFKDWGSKLLDRIILTPGTQAWDKFPYKLMKQKWDIGIAPLIDDEFNRSKSHIKWLEYTMKGIPTVASNVEPYKGIKQGVTGLLCDTQNDWYDALVHLIKNKQDRKKLADNAMKEVLKNWQYDKGAKEWKKAISSVLKLK